MSNTTFTQDEEGLISFLENNMAKMTADPSSRKRAEEMLHALKFYFHNVYGKVQQKKGPTIIDQAPSQESNVDEAKKSQT